MNIQEYSFQTKDLEIDLNGILKVLGFPDSLLPSPFDSYLTEALDFISQLDEIRAVCVQVDNIELNLSKGIINAGGQTFKAGKTICKELKNAEELLFFICTAGKSLSEISAAMLKGEEPVKGYIFDQVGVFLTEAAGDRMEQLIRNELPSGMKMTNRYSPGYCHWDVSDQHRLFSLFPPSPCGVTLTSSALMTPVKSISGVIGIGREVGYRDYPCALCLSHNCIYRKVS